MYFTCISSFCFYNQRSEQETWSSIFEHFLKQHRLHHYNGKICAKKYSERTNICLKSTTTTKKTLDLLCFYISFVNFELFPRYAYGVFFDRYWFAEFKALRCYFQQVYFETPGADTGRALRKKGSQSFNKIHRKTPLLGQSCNFIKKEAPSQMFSCEFCKIFRKTFLTEHLRVTASETQTILDWRISQLIFTCSKSTIETLEKSMKCVQS